MNECGVYVSGVYVSGVSVISVYVSVFLMPCVPYRSLEAAEEGLLCGAFPSSGNTLTCHSHH